MLVQCPHCADVLKYKPELKNEFFEHCNACYLDTTRPKKNKCEFCAKRFVSPRYKAIHEISLHGKVANWPEGLHPDEDKNLKKRDCHICGKVLYFNPDLTSHLKTEHQEGRRDIPKLMCQICDIGFETSFKKTRHDKRKVTLVQLMAPLLMGLVFIGRIFSPDALGDSPKRYFFSRCIGRISQASGESVGRIFSPDDLGDSILERPLDSPNELQFNQILPMGWENKFSR